MLIKSLILAVSIVSMSAIYATANSNSQNSTKKVNLEFINERFQLRDQFKEKGNPPTLLKQH